MSEPVAGAFAVVSRTGAARRGRLVTAHGALETPAFMPVGTLGAVKGLGPPGLRRIGAQIMLANLYHLVLRPGIELVRDLGGLHAFTGWRGPLLTDSGGYQIFSLSGMRSLDDDGVTFRSVLDGGVVRFDPESVVRWQRQIGVDIAMMLDECPPWPVEHAVAARALERTNSWAVRAAAEHARAETSGTLLFGIVQGSFYEDLRARAVEALVPLGFDGYAIGGVSVGEERELGARVVRQVATALPEDRPRYLMGVGTPADIAAAVDAGVDMFDCVLPSRNARHGFLFTSAGPLRILNAAHKRDERPVDAQCNCETCGSVSRAFLHHLFKSREITGRVLATIHNLRFYLDFMERLREALELGRPARSVCADTGEPEPDHVGKTRGADERRGA